MTIQQWMAMQSEQELKTLVGHVPFALSYGLVKAYQLLPEQAKAILHKAYQEAQ